MLKVLVVDDEESIRKEVIYTVDWMNMGCIITAEASDGREGIEKILRLKPDIVITDIRMPLIDGIKMISCTKDKVHYKSIILTECKEFSCAQEAIDLKVSEYFIKPLDKNKLEQVIKELYIDIEKEKEIERLFDKQSKGIDLREYSISMGKENPYISKMLQIMEEKYMDKISVESIAQEIGISPSYLSRKFKSTTGFTFLEFLNRYRIHQAIVLMKKRKYKIYEISDKTGFANYKHFNTVFKKYIGQSPTEFMK